MQTLTSVRRRGWSGQIASLPLSFLPAGLRVAQPCRYCFYSLAQKWVFRPSGATHSPDKRESWHRGAARRSAPPCQLSRLSGQKWAKIIKKLYEWPNSYKLKIQDGGDRHLEFQRNVNNCGLDIDIYIKVYGKMHHGHAEMTS